MISSTSAQGMKNPIEKNISRNWNSIHVIMRPYNICNHGIDILKGIGNISSTDFIIFQRQIFLIILALNRIEVKHTKLHFLQ